MARLFKLWIPGAVTPKQSTRVTVRGGRAHGYQPAKVKNYEAYVRGLAAEEWRHLRYDYIKNKIFGETLDQPIELMATFWVPRPKSRGVKRYPHPDRKPDLLNMLKPIEDAIEAAGVLCNDSRVCQMQLWKRYADKEHPIGVLVELWEIEK